MQHLDDHDVDDNNDVDADDDVEDADDDVDEDEVDVDEDEDGVDGALMSPAQGASVVTPAVGPWEPITYPQLRTFASS